MPESRCQYCDDTGDVTRVDGEYLGRCKCPAAFDLAGIAAALRTQRQVDVDGAEVGVSRQAADEAASIIEWIAARL